MEVPPELLDTFWEAMPARVTEATSLWLQIEQGQRHELSKLQRILHSIKGEAQMLGLEDCELLAQSAEDLVEALGVKEAWPEDAGAALLGAFERFSMLAPGVEMEIAIGIEDMGELLDSVLAGLGDVDVEARTAAGRQRQAKEEAAAEPGDETFSGKVEQAPAAKTELSVAVEELEPVVNELRRLYGEQAVLYPRLRELQQMLRTLLQQIDPKSSTPEELYERVVKTLGFGTQIERRLGTLAADWSANEFSTNQMVDQIEELMREASVVSLTRLQMQLHRAVRGAAQILGKQVEVDVRGDTMLDAAVERRLGPALMHLVRNAVDHGIEAPAERVKQGKPETGKLVVTITRTESNIRIVVEDDGGGVDFEKLRKRLAPHRRDVDDLSERDLLKSIFEHGVSTQDTVTQISGRGVGLDIVSTEVATIGGRVHVETSKGLGTRFVILLPASLRVDTVIPVRAGVLRCAVPSRMVRAVTRVERLDATPEGPVMPVEISDEEQLVPVRSLAALLDEKGEPRVNDAALIVDHPQGHFAVTVDSYDDPRPLVNPADDTATVRTGTIQGVVPAPDGGVLLLLDVVSLRTAVARPLMWSEGEGVGAAQRRNHILVVEDTPVARALLCGVLRSFGFRVSEAIDGQEGLATARSDRPDVILSDIEMPVMNGLEMIEALRNDPKLRHIPVAILSTRTDEATRTRAEALGVMDYLAKRNFAEDELRRVIERCLRQGGRGG